MPCLFAKFVQKKKSTILNIHLSYDENVYRVTPFNLRPSSTSEVNGMRIVTEILYWIFNFYHLLTKYIGFATKFKKKKIKNSKNISYFDTWHRMKLIYVMKMSLSTPVFHS